MTTTIETVEIPTNTVAETTATTEIASSDASTTVMTTEKPTTVSLAGKKVC